MTCLIPRPLRDIATGPSAIRAAVTAVQHTIKEDDEMEIQGASLAIAMGGKDFILPPACRMALAAYRIMLAAAGVFAAYKLGISITVAAIAGSIVSLPAAAIAGGSWMLYHGVLAIVASIATSTFAAAKMGLLYAIGGWVALEYHDIIAFGIADMLINKEAKNIAPSIADYFAPAQS